MGWQRSYPEACQTRTLQQYPMGRPLPQMVPQYGSALVRLDREHGNSTTPYWSATRMRQIDLLPEHPASRTAAVLHRQHRFQQAPGYGVGFAPLCPGKHRRVRFRQGYAPKLPEAYPAKANVSTRLPYQTANRNLRRYATFIATSNNFNILTDPTGSRRFICIEVTDTIDYTQPIDYEQLYAQAMEALANGERYWFTHEEETEIVANNRQFQQIPPEEQLFLQYFRLPKKNEAGEFLLSIEILGRIKQKQRDFSYTKTVISNFGRLLKRNGIPSKRSNRGTIYQVVELSKS